MHDMLVRLYHLPSLDEALAAVTRHGVTVKRAIAPDAPAILAWVVSTLRHRHPKRAQRWRRCRRAASLHCVMVRSWALHAMT